jgi:hypothetical protein
MTPSAAVADFGGRRYRRFIPSNFLLSLAAPHINGILVLVKGNKFIAGVVVTGDNCSPVSLSPPINCSLVSRYRQSLKIRDKDKSPVSATPAINFLPVSLTPLNSLSPVSATISANFRKKFKKAQMKYLGAWGTLIHEKNLKSKISCQTLFNALLFRNQDTPPLIKQSPFSLA